MSVGDNDYYCTICNSHVNADGDCPNCKCPICGSTKISGGWLDHQLYCENCGVIKNV